MWYLYPVPEKNIDRRGLVIRCRAEAARFRFLYDILRRGKAYARYLAGRPHDPDFAAFALLPGSGLFMDVGASIGQSALSFRVFNKQSPIISFEPLPSHQGDLRFVRRVVRDFDFRILGAGAQTEQRTMFIPAVGRYDLPAESSLNRTDAESVLERVESYGIDRGTLRIREVQVQLTRLDDLGLEPSFVKIDVEGAELAVLEGMRETIDAHRPHLMIERSDRFPEVIEMLSGYGYETFTYDPAERAFRPFEGQDSLNLFYLNQARPAALPATGTIG